MQELWTNWPQRELDGLAKTYVLVQWSFWSQQVLVMNLEARRKDYWQILTHHVVTIMLIAASYAYHHTRVGNVILVLMDAIELLFPLAKCLKYLGFSTACDVVFGLFMVTWFASRHVFYLMICWSIHYDAPGLLTSACYRGTADDLQGPFPTSYKWSDLLAPFRDPAGTVCSNDTILTGFLVYLLALQVIMVMWFALIIRVAIKVLKGSGAEDVRSDSEMEEEVAEYARPEPIEQEVGVEGIDLKQWERRTGAKRATSSTGITLPGHSDRKELLNRIGCEKQID
ncbi:Sphingosine N-acyltransferase lag1 [Diatrype stigma]|uniref:Sphingosine N-acyltransferase lag1 n=1 Tax=Diatrype stigma TaxID=117547 RepID=A0AAN9UFZ0_9PEZI